MSLMPQPLISCIMPTFAGRPSFRPSPLDCFFRQTWKRRELIIVSDAQREIGAPSIESGSSGDMIRRIVCTPGMTTGEKRNLACEAAKGEFIAHWDDDDWYDRDRLTNQMQWLEGSPRPMVTAVNHALFFDVLDQSVWHYKGMQDRDIVGSSLFYARRFWIAHPFPARKLGEDREFAIAAWHAGRLCTGNFDRPPMMVARTHTMNTSNHRAGRDSQNWTRGILSDLPPEFFGTLEQEEAAS